jgi:tRNA(Ile)-lysidine synthetase-like protein
MSSAFDTAYNQLCALLAALPGTQPPKVLFGFSGGADSVFLLQLLSKARTEGRVVAHAVHLNHGWRTDAAENATFCATACTQYDIPYTIGHLKDYEQGIKQTGSQEDFGRRARQAFFAAVEKEQELDWRILGHHADDQLETFFIRMIRGSSLEGLVGMQPQTGKILRPLLGIYKQEIIEYLTAHNITWYHDTTNDSDHHLRNRIRRSLIPALELCDARSIKNIVSLQNSLHIDNDYLTMMTKTACTEIFTQKSHAQIPAGDLKQFQQQHPAIQNRLVMGFLIEHQFTGEFSKALISEVLRFLHTPRGGSHQVGNLTIYKKGSLFWCEKK